MNFAHYRRFTAQKRGATTSAPKPTVDSAIAVHATHSFTYHCEIVIQFSPVARCAGCGLATSPSKTQGEVA